MSGPSPIASGTGRARASAPLTMLLLATAASLCVGAVLLGAPGAVTGGQLLQLVALGADAPNGVAPARMRANGVRSLRHATPHAGDAVVGRRIDLADRYADAFDDERVRTSLPPPSA